MSTTTRTKRSLALFLAFVMLFSMFPTGVFAEEIKEENAVEEIKQPAENEGSAESEKKEEEPQKEVVDEQFTPEAGEKTEQLTEEPKKEALENAVSGAYQTEILQASLLNEAPAVVAKIGEQTYPTLAEAVAEAKDGATITLIKNAETNIENKYGITIDKSDISITLDLGGNTLSSEKYMGVWVRHGNVTIKNGTITGSGTIALGVTDGANLTLDSVTVQYTGSKTEHRSLHATNSDSSLSIKRNTNLIGDFTIESKNKNASVEAGTYNFDPTSYVDASKFYVDSTSISGSYAVKPIAVAPTAKTGLVENDTEQTGVEGGEGYNLTGTTKATLADDYTATATLEDGYVWADDPRTGDRTINWSIAEAPAVAKIGDTEYYKTLAGALKAAQSGTGDGKTVTVVGTVNGYHFDGNYDGIIIKGSETGKITGNFTAAKDASLKNVKFLNLKFEGCGIDFSNSGLQFENAVIQSCTFDGTGIPTQKRQQAITINVHHADKLLIDNNTIKNYTSADSSGGSSAILLGIVSGFDELVGEHVVTISNNTIEKIAHNAIQATDLAKLEIFNNTISDAKAPEGPINVYNTKVVSVSENTISLAENNKYILCYVNKGIVTMSDNTIKDSSGKGIEFTEELVNFLNYFDHDSTSTGFVLLKGTKEADDRYIAVSKDVITAAFPEKDLTLVSGTTYTYAPVVAKIGETGYPTLAAAVAAAAASGDATIQLLEDVTVEETLPINGSVRLDLSGHMLTGRYNEEVCPAIFSLAPSATLTVDSTEEEGTVIAQEDSIVFFSLEEQDAQVTILGGTYTTNSAVFSNAENPLSISITGGTFDFDPSDFVAEGYEATENDGTYTVAEVVKYAVMWQECEKASAVVTVADEPIGNGDKFAPNTEIVFTATPNEGYEYAEEPEGWTLKEDGTITMTVTVGDEGLSVEIPEPTEKATTPFGGTGEADDPYRIATKADLFYLAEHLNDDGSNFATAYYQQTNDIEMSLPFPGIGTYANNGGSASAFKGVYDGSGYEITNLVFANASGNQYRGLFNQIESATVKNLTVEARGFETGTTGEYGAANIVGHAYQSTIENCVAKGEATYTHNGAGIVIRATDATIKDCTNEANITGSYTKVAGIVVLSQNGTTGTCIEGCVNEGTITAQNGTTAGRDGVAGIIAYASSADKVTVKGCTNTGVIVKGTGASEDAKVGQIIGYVNANAKVENCTARDDTALIGACNGTARATGADYATHNGNTLTTVAAIAAGGTYFVLTQGAAPVIELAEGESIAFDQSLATMDDKGITAVAGCKIEKNTTGNVTTYAAVAEIPTVSWTVPEYATVVAFDAESLVIESGSKVPVGSEVKFMVMPMEGYEYVPTPEDWTLEEDGTITGTVKVDHDITVTIPEPTEKQAPITVELDGYRVMALPYKTESYPLSNVKWEGCVGEGTDILTAYKADGSLAFAQYLTMDGTSYLEDGWYDNSWEPADGLNLADYDYFKLESDAEGSTVTFTNPDKVAQAGSEPYDFPLEPTKGNTVYTYHSEDWQPIEAVFALSGSIEKPVWADVFWFDASGAPDVHSGKIKQEGEGSLVFAEGLIEQYLPIDTAIFVHIHDWECTADGHSCKNHVAENTDLYTYPMVLCPTTIQSGSVIKHTFGDDDICTVCGYEFTEPTYKVTWDEATNATVTATVDGNPITSGDAFVSGTVVAFTVTPKEGYEYATAPEGWKLEDGSITMTVTVGEQEVNVTIPAPTESAPAYVAQIGETGYPTLAAAIAAATDDQIITLLANITETYTLKVGETLKIAKNDFTFPDSNVRAPEEYVRKNTTTSGVTTYSCVAAIAKVTSGTIVSYIDTIKPSISNGATLTVQLLKDYSGTQVSLGSVTTKNVNITYDLNGHTLTLGYDNGYGVGFNTSAKGNTITLKNGTLNVTKGKIAISGKNNTVNLASDLTINTSVGAVLVEGNATLNTAATIINTGICAAIQTNGSTSADSVVNVTGGSISSSEVAIYHPIGTLNISGGTITGTTAVYAKAGTVSISGGTLAANGEKADYKFNGNGCYATGDALVVDNCGYGEANVSITGGTFTSTNANALGVYTGNGETEIAEITKAANMTLTAPEGYVWDANGKLGKVVVSVDVKEITASTLTTEEPADDQVMLTINTTEGAAQKDEESAKNAVIATVNDNAAVESFTETGLDKNLDMETVMEKVLETVTGATEENVSKRIVVDLKSATVVQSEEGSTVKTMSFDVKPIARVTVSGKTTEFTITKDMITEPLRFRLPVDKSVEPGTIATVKHEDTVLTDKTYVVKGDDNGNYIEVASKEFSLFSYELTDQVIYNNDKTLFTATLTLKDNIDMNLYLKVPKGTSKDDVNLYKVVATFTGDEGDTVSTFELKNVEKFGNDGGYDRYKMVLCEVYSYQMTRPINIKVYFNGELVKNVDYSVQKYLEGEIESEANTGKTDYLNLCKAVLDYGAEAQKYFNGKTYYKDGRAIQYVTDSNNLANAKYTSSITPDKPASDVSRNGSISGVKSYSVSLILGSETSFKFYMKGEGLNESDFSVSCDGDKTPTAVTKEKDGRLSFTVPGIKSYELSKKYTITISGPESETTTITYSAFSYAAGDWSGKDDSALCQALVNYGNAANTVWPE